MASKPKRKRDGCGGVLVQYSVRGHQSLHDRHLQHSTGRWTWIGNLRTQSSSPGLVPCRRWLRQRRILRRCGILSHASLPCSGDQRRGSVYCERGLHGRGRRFLLWYLSERTLGDLLQRCGRRDPLPAGFRDVLAGLRQPDRSGDGQADALHVRHGLPWHRALRSMLQEMYEQCGLRRRPKVQRDRNLQPFVRL